MINQERLVQDGDVRREWAGICAERCERCERHFGGYFGLKSGVTIRYGRYE